jgi:coenzyme Q-binding protein COQ10
MAGFSYSRRVPYPRPGVFDIVADIERYPDFLPGVREARILSGSCDRLRVEQQVGIASWTWRFRTEAVLSRPETVRITTDEAPFRHLDQVWRFHEADDGATSVSLVIDYDLRSAMLQRLAGGLFEDTFRRMIAAFEARLHQRLAASPPAR